MIGGRRVIDRTVQNNPCRRGAEQDVVDSAARIARNLRPAAACQIEAVRCDRLQFADDASVVALRADGVAAEGVDAQLLAGSVVRLAAGVGPMSSVCRCGCICCPQRSTKRQTRKSE